MQEKGFFGRLFDLSFNEFITTKIIKVLYVIAMVASAFGGLAVMFGMFASKTFFGVVGGLIAGPVLFLVYVILARVWMEVVIVLFRIAENTAKLANPGGTTPQA
jgi:hypothetical protein